MSRPRRQTNRGRGRRPKINRQLNTLTNFDTLVYHGHEQVAPFPAGNAGFTVSSNVINCALLTQLSNFAGIYSEYRFTRLRFAYMSAETHNANLGEIFISYSNDIASPAPASINNVVTRALSLQVPTAATYGIGLPQQVSNFRRSFPNSLDIPRSYNNVLWYRTRTSAGANDMNSTGIVHYGTQSVNNGDVPGVLYIIYTIVFRSHT